MKKAQKGVVVKKKNQLGKRSIAGKSKRKEDRVANKAANKTNRRNTRSIKKAIKKVRAAHPTSGGDTAPGNTTYGQFAPNATRPIKQKGGRTLDQKLADKKKKQDARNAASVSRAKSQADVKNIRSSAKGVASRNKGYSSRADEVKKVADVAASTRSKVKGTAKTKNKNFTGDRRLKGDNVDSHNTRTRTSNNKKTRTSNNRSSSTKTTTKNDYSYRSKSNNQSPSQSSNASTKQKQQQKKTNRSGVGNNQSKTTKTPKSNSSLPKKRTYPRGLIQAKKTGGRVIKGNSLRFTRKK